MITKDMTIQKIIETNEGVAPILMAAGMHCLGCAMAHGETLEQACTVHGIDVDKLAKQIKDYLGE